MITVKLIYPKRDIEKVCICQDTEDARRVVRGWKKCYGMLFKVCVLIVDRHNNKRNRQVNERRVINLHTGEIAENLRDAEIKFDTSYAIIRDHCHKLHKGGRKKSFNYKFKFEDSENTL